jgi:hypothetical protein
VLSKVSYRKKITVMMEVAGVEKEDVSSYWMTSRKGKDTVN